MSLQVTLTDTNILVSTSVLQMLKNVLERYGHAVLLVPSFVQAVETQRMLAEEDGLALGVTTTTPNAWVDERWEVWGDGRQMVSGAERLILMRLALRDAHGPLAPTSGTLDALARIARTALPWLPTPVAPGVGGAPWDALTEGEQAACVVLSRYHDLLADRGLIEHCEAARLLVSAVPQWDPVVLTGMPLLRRPIRELLLRVSRDTEVGVFASLEADGASLLVDQLVAEAHLLGIEVDVSHDFSSFRRGEGELADLRDCIFQGPEAGQVIPQGAVRLAESEGPLAEWPLVASQIRDLQDAGMNEVVVAVPDVEAAWRGLAPRLAVGGSEVTCSLRRNAALDLTVTAFLGYAQMVARLAELDETWPESTQEQAGTVPQLGDMSWWPPRELTDFLLSSISQVDQGKAWELDVKWRGNRSLTPRMVLDQLQRESLTSKVVAQATASLLRGRVGTAALQLARSLAEAGVADGAVLSALGSVQDVARTLGAMGVSASQKSGVREVLPLGELVSLIGELVGHVSLSCHLKLGEGSPRHVRICSRGDAAQVAAGSADALVACGLTSEEWPLSPHDDAAMALLERVGCADVEDPLVVARRQFRSMLSVPTRALVLERTLHGVKAKRSYPAVMLIETLACYGAETDNIPRVKLDESEADRLLTVSAEKPTVVQSVIPAPAGQVGLAAADMVVVPREGEKVRPDGLPSLSASQIESYLECPYKWFTLRRLGLGDNDATFSPVQMGSFVHRVLEVSRRMLMQQAAQDAGLVGPGQLLDLEGTDITFVPGSAVTEENVDLALELVGTEFDYHLAHQRQKGTTLAVQSLVPHTATEEYQLVLLRRDLLSEVSFEVGRFRGFAPRYFELRFGGPSAKAHHVIYAGVDFVGTIDRVDVDAHGRAVVIDYKHKGANGFSAEYDAFEQESPASLEELKLPRRVQSLIYAQIVRRMFPELKVVGAVYLSTRGGSRHQHEIAGVLDADAADMVMGKGLGDSRWKRMVVGGLGKLSFEELLDETERRIAEKIAHLVEGHIEAEPVDKNACAWCPVANCDRRLD